MEGGAIRSHGNPQVNTQEIPEKRTRVESGLNAIHRRMRLYSHEGSSNAARHMPAPVDD